jgi:hypothetical protein
MLPLDAINKTNSEGIDPQFRVVNFITNDAGPVVCTEVLYGVGLSLMVLQLLPSVALRLARKQQS